MHVSETKDKAVLFAYDVHPRFREKLIPVKLQGLEQMETYTVKEINLMLGVKSELSENGKTYTGDYLMKVGIDAFMAERLNSRVIEIEAH